MRNSFMNGCISSVSYFVHVLLRSCSRNKRKKRFTRVSIYDRRERVEWEDVCRNIYDGDVGEKVLIFLILREMVLLIDGDFLNNFCKCGQDETNIVEHPV